MPHYMSNVFRLISVKLYHNRYTNLGARGMIKFVFIFPKYRNNAIGIASNHVLVQVIVSLNICVSLYKNLSMN